MSFDIIITFTEMFIFMVCLLEPRIYAFWY